MGGVALRGIREARVEMKKNSVSPVWEVSLQVKLERSMRTPRSRARGFQVPTQRF